MMSKFIWCVVGVSMAWLAAPALAQQDQLVPTSHGAYYGAPGGYMPMGPCARCGWHLGSSWEGYCHECSRCWTLVDSLHALKENLFGWLHHGGVGCCPQAPCPPCRHGLLPRLWRPAFRGPCCDHPPVGHPAEIEEGPTPTEAAPERATRAVPRSPRSIGAAVFRRPVPRRAYRSPSYRSTRPVPRRAY